MAHRLRVTQGQAPVDNAIDVSFRINDGKIDIVVDDTDRDGKWDISFHDVDFNGTIDLVGYHPDGKITPSRYETYKAYVARLNWRAAKTFTNKIRQFFAVLAEAYQPRQQRCKITCWSLKLSCAARSDPRGSAARPSL